MNETKGQRYYHLTTFGCQMNEHDSEHIRGVLEADGWITSDDPEQADLLVFNTCSVRESAESRLLGRLGEASRLKKERPDRLIALGGCFAQRQREAIFSRVPFLDVAFGPQNIGDLPDLLMKASQTSMASSSFRESPAHSADLPASRLSGSAAWVQAMTGCTNFCSYCIVPSVRGPEKSRDAADVVDEVRRLVESGISEITILGQNVNAYGLDAPPATVLKRFPDLLAALNDIEGLDRIRFTTSHPKDLDDDLVEAIRELPKVCEHLHLPAQSGSSRILERMRRGYSREHYIHLIEKAYDNVPGLALTTDLIVGFPGEKEDDFYRTLTLVEQCRFDGAFTFKYSPRPGTEAAGLPGTVPELTIARRMKELINITQKIAKQQNLDLVGRFMEVKVEGESRQGGSQMRGRTRSNKIVNFASGGAAYERGDLVQVKINGGTSMTLTGSA